MSNKQELVRKVKALVERRFSGDFSRAFRHYAAFGIGDGAIDSDELKEMLSDADVGNGLTRGTWASEIMKVVDIDGDDKITWREFQDGVLK